MKLEELARQSSTAARTSVSRLGPPPIGEPRRPGWLVPAFAGTAVVALVVGGLAVINRNGGNAETVPAATVPAVTDPPRLVLGPDTEGWQLISAMSLEEMSADAISTPTFSYFGTSGADDPFAEGDLLIGTIQNIDEPTSTEGESIDLRGTTAVVSDGTDEFGFSSTIVEWTETDADGNRLDLVVASRGLDRDAVVDTVENLVVDIAAGSATPADGLGLDLLVRSNDLPLFGRTSGDGWLASYQGARDAFAVLTSATGSLAESAITLHWWSDGVENVLVGAHPALLATLPVESRGINTVAARTLMWSPELGVIAALNLFGDQPDEPVALAETVVEVTPAEWAALTEAVSSPDDFADDGSEVLGDPNEVIGDGGETVDGVAYEWRIELGDDDLCFLIEASQSGGSSCQPIGPLLEALTEPARTVDATTFEGLTAMLVLADSTVEEIRPIDARISIDRVPWDGRDWIVAVGPDDADTELEVIVDGEIVHRIDASVAMVEEEPSPSPTPDELAGGIPVIADSGHEDIVFVADGETDGLRWAIGESVAGLCLYTAGATDSVSCNEPGDISVFAPVQLGRGERFIVVADSTQTCLPTLRQPAGSGETLTVVGPPAVFVIGESVADWQLVGLDRDGRELATVALPEQGSTDWRNPTCEP